MTLLNSTAIAALIVGLTTPMAAAQTGTAQTPQLERAAAERVIVDDSGAAKQRNEQVIDRIVENSRTDEDGLVQPSTGAAKPKENWFGCTPTSDAPTCERASPLKPGEKPAG